MGTTVVCISDTHGLHDRIKLPAGDFLVHSGDFTSSGKVKEVRDFADWFRSQPHKHKVVIPGNHDWYAEQSARECEALFHGVNYAIHGCIQVAGFKIGMFAFQPRFFDWAFNVDRNSPKMEFLWSRIDDDCDIIVSHGPPHGLCDLTPRGEEVGCEVMYRKLYRCEKLKLVVCGHIHEGYGEVDWWAPRRTTPVRIVNASVCDGVYRPVNQPIMVTL